MLDERGEQMLAQMLDIHSSFDKIYSDLIVNDTRYEQLTDREGNTFTVNDAAYGAAMASPDRDFRKAFFEKLLGTYGGYINTISSNYYALVKSNVYIAKSRGYQSARSQSLSANFIPEEVYDNLLATVRANTAPFQRYIALRNRVLGIEKSHMYDLFVPIVPAVTRQYSFDEAYELMLKATAILGEDYTELVKRSRDERWCDVYPRQGKVSGAYSTSVYDVHPYMLLNFNGTLDDVFTLVHETGHSMHSWYSDQSQPFIYSDYTLFCAEVASTTNEMLLYHYLLDHAESKAERAALLSKHLDDIRSTFYGRRCSPTLRTRPTVWSSRASRSYRRCCATFTARSTPTTTARTLRRTNLSPTNGHVSRTFTGRFTSTSTRRASRRRLRLQSASATLARRRLRTTRSFCAPGPATTRSSCCGLPG